MKSLIKKSKNYLIAALVFVFILVLSFAAIRDWTRGYFEVTSYPVGRMADGTWTLPLNRTIYRVYPNEHRAIYWLPGVLEAPSELVNCVIRDKCNWSCSYPNDPSEIRMGNCMEETMDGEWSRPTTATEWWNLH